MLLTLSEYDMLSRIQSLKAVAITNFNREKLTVLQDTVRQRGLLDGYRGVDAESFIVFRRRRIPTLRP